MAGSNGLRLKGRIQMSETSYLQIGHIQLATHGRSIQTCRERTWAEIHTFDRAFAAPQVTNVASPKSRVTS